MRQVFFAFDQALLLLERAETNDAWQRALQSLADDEDGDNLLRGFAVRTLYDRGCLPVDVMAVQFRVGAFAIGPAS